jgi:hypothetical protein
MRSTSFVGALRLRRLSALLSLSALACCAHDAVLAFHVEPPLACANQTVAITWQVRGRALLKANPAPANWKEDVASVGSLPAVTVAQDTTFTIVAPDANPARGASFASQTAQVTAQADPRAVQAKCDTSGNCTGTLLINADPSVRVSQIANPTWRSGFKVTDHDLCVTPPGGQRTCLASKASATLGVPANGTWTFDTKLAQNESGDPPPELRVVFDFGCK